MATEGREPGFPKERCAELEIALIEMYLGRTLRSLNDLPPEHARRLRIAASLYASLRLEELKATSHLVKELHGRQHESM
jgi:hypothetical protein